jgi:hypothetical protein
MRLFNKLFSVIAILIFLTGVAFADSAGIVFDWQPFIVNNCLDLNRPLKNTLPENYFIRENIIWKFNDIEYLLSGDSKIVNNYPAVAVKRSARSKIKVTISAGNSFLLPGDEIYSNNKEGKLSRAADILPSLLRNPSQETAVETLKLIEPRINLGFEF